MKDKREKKEAEESIYAAKKVDAAHKRAQQRVNQYIARGRGHGRGGGKGKGVGKSSSK